MPSGWSPMKAVARPGCSVSSRPSVSRSPVCTASVAASGEGVVSLQDHHGVPFLRPAECRAVRAAGSAGRRYNGRMTFEQATYQVRFDWGPAGVEAIGADADVVVWVDAIATGPPPDLPPAPRRGARRRSADVGGRGHWLLALQERLAPPDHHRRRGGRRAARRRVEPLRRRGPPDGGVGDLAPRRAGDRRHLARSRDGRGRIPAARAGARAPGQRRRHRPRGSRSAGAFRVDEALGTEAVLVRRPHPDAGSGAVSPG